MAQKKKATSQKIGSTLAVFQGLCDDLFSFGFRKLKEIGKKKIEKKDEAPALQQSQKYARKTARFLGEMGESFYETYEEIKRKKKENNKK